MNRLFLIAFVVFASTILLTQIVSSAEGKYSEARKKAKERNDLVVEKERAAAIKKLSPSTTVSAISKPKTQAEVNTSNAAYLSSLNTAKENLKQAKEDLNLANRAYLRDSSSSAKKQAVADAEVAVKNAENALKIVILNKP
ncbi:MAG: hypothetical protein EPO62_07270 [Candidatus Nitrosotenuis sp.]|nr:MAG: hypothetical protein EPO62_07270 [Candidatus Nitrosotenuis sp.]